MITDVRLLFTEEINNKTGTLLLLELGMQIID